MSQISASDVKTLREMTGAGMMDCKKALAEVGGNLDAAVDYLRKKGLSAAAKKADRVAAEGLVAAISGGNAGVVLEVNSETDFVSKNDKFQAFVAKVAEVILANDPADVESLKALPYGDGNNVGETLTALIATIGENMSIRRFQRLSVNSGLVAAYIHGGGKIGVLVAIEGNAAALGDVGRGVAMHVAAANPRFVARTDVDAASIERERAVLTERAAASGKPANILDKIVEGQMGKFYADVCLLEQGYVIDPDLTVGKAVAAADKGATVTAMARFQLGEGLAKREENFAAEVAAAVQG